MSNHHHTTIVFPVSDRGILLGMKKRGFGVGWWNGFGGKLEAGETYEESAARETMEEVGIKIHELRYLADLAFYFDGKLDMVSRAYSASFTGEPAETDEMRPQLFELDKLPYDQMWAADKIWIPKVLLHGTPEPVGFVIHFNRDNSFKSLEEVGVEALADKFSLTAV